MSQPRRSTIGVAPLKSALGSYESAPKCRADSGGPQGVAPPSQKYESIRRFSPALLPISNNRIGLPREATDLRQAERERRATTDFVRLRIARERVEECRRRGIEQHTQELVRTIDVAAAALVRRPRRAELRELSDEDATMHAAHQSQRRRGVDRHRRTGEEFGDRRLTLFAITRES